MAYRIINNSNKILSYEDVARYKAGSSNEPLVSVASYDPTIKAKYIKRDMLPITGEIIYVRDSVARKLASVEAYLRKQGYCLRVVYGYRHPDIQMAYFTKRKDEIAKEKPGISDKDLESYVHNFVAVPDIAGHPTGAAIDATLTTLDGDEVDMGSAIADYSDEDIIKTQTDGLTSEQIKNRKLLHDAMVSEGFAPFYGEWWHFSYGDREWAAFYEKEALYDIVDFTIK